MNRNVFLLSCLIAAAVIRCEKTELAENPGNAQVFFDVTSTNAVTGQDLTINRFRVLKAAPNSSSAGVASVRDSYWVDVTGTLTGETKSRTTRLGPFYADADGYLFGDGFDPGTFVYNDTITGTSGSGIGTDIYYEVTAKDGLISSEWNVYPESQTIVTENGATSSVKRQLVKVSDQDSSFTNIRLRTYIGSPMFSRTRYQDNSDLSLKGKLGCYNKTTDSSGNTSYATTPTWYDVELGNVISDKDGTISSTKTGTDDSSASDQILWVQWTEKWYLTGLNINTKTARIVRERGAPFYFNRELPRRVITTAASGSPAPSGIEKMIRACSNDVEVTSGSKVFFLAGFIAGSGSTTYSSFSRSVGTGTANCSATKTVANTVALTQGYSGGATVFAGCAGLTGTSLGITVTGGTWDGTKSSSIISSVASNSLYFIEHSAIVDVTF